MGKYVRRWLEVFRNFCGADILMQFSAIPPTYLVSASRRPKMRWNLNLMDFEGNFAQALKIELIVIIQILSINKQDSVFQYVHATDELSPCQQRQCWCNFLRACRQGGDVRRINSVYSQKVVDTTCYDSFSCTFSILWHPIPFVTMSMEWSSALNGRQKGATKAFLVDDWVYTIKFIRSVPYVQCNV